MRLFLAILLRHRLNMELDLQSLFGLVCTAVLIGWAPQRPPPPQLGSYTCALLVSQGRRHLFLWPSYYSLLVCLLSVCHLRHRYKLASASLRASVERPDPWGLTTLSQCTEFLPKKDLTSRVFPLLVSAPSFAAQGIQTHVLQIWS
jgi:hypothetical protein